MFAALSGVLGTASLVWGRVWMINGPDHPRELDSLPQLLQFEQPGDATMTVLDLPAWVRFLAAAPGLAQALMLAAAAFLLMRVLIEIADGRSFGAEVQRGLGRIGWLLVVGSFIVLALDVLALWRIEVEIWAFADAVRNDGGVTSTGIGTELPRILWLPLALGFVAFALRWAFKDGARLEKDAEGVI
ncbi:DUF2975 domain-containing protein [Pseudactinotalea terrae]|uniref:DUF2975 domain-containing protein n=1 Tax=Pseudactinotalea terrae TaxID=1743262 RepID=UPI0012E107BF|nr:DUF2975 domain-containing protein [Pseudactinotalea terrae]